MGDTPAWLRGLTPTPAAAPAPAAPTAPRRARERSPVATAYGLRRLARDLGLLPAEQHALDHSSGLRTYRQPRSRWPAAPNPWNLSPTQVQVVRRLVLGKNSKQIADELAISHKTVDVHRLDICDRMGCIGRGIRSAVLWDRWEHLQQQQQQEEARRG